jgi:hypothetical protein
VAPGCEWTLLLVLHLLRELRNPKSPWQAYTQLLPAPPGSLLKKICNQGPNATDLLLFRYLSTFLSSSPPQAALGPALGLTASSAGVRVPWLLISGSPVPIMLYYEHRHSTIIWA